MRAQNLGSAVLVIDQLPGSPESLNGTPKIKVRIQDDTALDTNLVSVAGNAQGIPQVYQILIPMPENAGAK